MVHISELPWNDVEKFGSLYRQGCFFCPSNKGRRFRFVATDYCKSPSSVTLVETNVVALDQPLGHLPKENDPIPLPTALLGIEL